MKKLVVLSLLIAIAFIQCTKKIANNMNKVDDEKSWRKMVPKSGAAKVVQLGDYQSFDLDNGLKVILVESHKKPIVSFQLSLNHDPVMQGDKVGYVSMAGDLLSKGTSKRSKSELDNAIDFIGASLNTSSNGIVANSLTKHAEVLMEIMSEIILDASFSNEEFEKSKKQALSGITMSLSNADAMMTNVREVVNYGDNHPYGEIQTIETTENIDLASCKQYYNTYFRPNNAYLIIVGDMTLTQAKTMADKYYSDWEKKDIPKVDYSVPTNPSKNNVVFVHKEGAVQSVINVSYPVDLKPNSSDVIKARVMNAILGGGIFSGRLMQNLREDHAYTYGARSGLSSDPLVGNFRAFANVRNEVTDSSVTQFLYEMNRLVTEKVNEEDLQLVKNSMTGGFARSLESPQTIARFARNTFKYNLDKNYYKNYLKSLATVSVDDIQQMAAKYIKPENANIIIVGDKQSVSKGLIQFDGNNKIDFYDAFGNIVVDAKVDVSKMSVEEVLNKYIKAIGGKNKLEKIKSMKQLWSVDLMGQSASIEKKFQENNMFMMEMKMGGQSMQSQKYNGKILKNIVMGKMEEFTTGDEVNSVKEEAQMFEQLSQLQKINGYKTNVEGAEVIEGEECVKLMVTNSEGDASSVFYSMESGFMVKKVVVEEIQGEMKTISTDYKNYKDYGGVKIASEVTLNGVMPIPLKMVLSEVKLNEKFTNSDFE